MLTLQRSQIPDLLANGDTRWLHRASYDLMDYRTNRTESQTRMPPGTSLYGSLPEQLRDTNSFAWRLREILAVRTRYRMAACIQVEVPSLSNRALLVMVHLLDSGLIQITALNFSQEQIAEPVTSKHLAVNDAVIDMFTDQVIATVDQTHTFPIVLEPHQGMSLLIVHAAFRADLNEPLPANHGLR
jgi:hypothetical protein